MEGRMKMSEKNYESPMIDIINYDNEDIITNSDPANPSFTDVSEGGLGGLNP